MITKTITRSPTRCDFERHLNDAGILSDERFNLPNMSSSGVRHYGTWLYRNAPEEFARQFKAWREKGGAS